MSNLMMLPNGDLYATQGIDTENIPNGYERHMTERNLLLCILDPCIYRLAQLYKKRCGKMGCVNRCSLKGIEINTTVCEECKDGVPPST